MLDVIAIEMAVEKYRQKHLESYKNCSDTELICGVLASAGLFGSMAARMKNERNELQKKIDEAVGRILKI